MRVREAKARKVIGRKTVRGKEYVYEYYTLPLNLYLPKDLVEKWGTEFIVEMNEIEGEITIKPKKLWNKLESPDKKVREVKARKITLTWKERVYEYNALSLNLYLPKGMIERYGTEYIVRIDEEEGITIKPKT